MEIKQFQIVLVNLNQTPGSVIKKVSPCVVFSPNEINKNLRTVVTAPMNSTSKKYPTLLKVKHNSRDAWIVFDQIRKIEKKRITKKFGSLFEEEMRQCKSIVQETFVY